MSKDRIKDLQQNTSRPSVAYTAIPREPINHEDQNDDLHENSHSITITTEPQSNVTDFLQETDLVRSLIDQIDEFAQEVKDIHTEMLQPLPNPKLAQELDDKTEKIKNLSYDVSATLKKMEDAKANRTELDKSNAQWRIKESQIFVLTRRFQDTMKHYNQETVLHRERCKKIIVCELQLAGQLKSKDDIDDIIDNGYPGTFSISILVDTQKAEQSLHEIEARHRDIVKLEATIKELHSMFHDLAMLVAQQGEMIDCIEHNVLQAIDYVEDAAENVNIAEQYGRKAVKKKIIILIIVSIAVVILMIVFIGHFAKKKIVGR